MQMKKIGIIGIVLVVAAVVAAAAVQISTHGLVETEHWKGHRQMADPRIVITGVTETTCHTRRLLPFLGVALIGWLCIFASRPRHESAP